jgi:hypothetical protein
MPLIEGVIACKDLQKVFFELLNLTCKRKMEDPAWENGK